jgi:hypothetical protein
MEEYLTTDELSQRIKMKPGSIRNLISNGRFILNVHYVKPTPKKLLFIWSAVEAWLYNPNPPNPSTASPTPVKRPQNGCLLEI